MKGMVPAISLIKKQFHYISVYVYTHRINELRVVSQRFLADERGSIPPTPVLSGERLRAEELRLGDQRLRADELSRRGTGFT